MVELPDSLKAKYPQFVNAMRDTKTAERTYLESVQLFQQKDQRIRETSRLYQIFGENALPFFKLNGETILTVRLVDLKFFKKQVDQYLEISGYLASQGFPEATFSLNQILDAADGLWAKVEKADLDKDFDLTDGDVYVARTTRNKEICDLILEIGTTVMTQGYIERKNPVKASLDATAPKPRPVQIREPVQESVPG